MNMLSPTSGCEIKVERKKKEKWKQKLQRYEGTHKTQGQTERKVWEWVSQCLSYSTLALNRGSGPLWLPQEWFRMQYEQAPALSHASILVPRNYWVWVCEAWAVRMDLWLASG